MDRRIEILQDGKTVLAENGPMRLTIQALDGDRADIEVARAASEFAFSCLAEVAAHRELLRFRDPGLVGHFQRLKAPVAQKMMENVLVFDVPDLTPMATVAGTMADAVADWIFNRNMTRVIVENGGDIAVRLTPDERVRVGVRKSVSRPDISHILTLDGSRSSWGVNTSGLGGRSLTRGIASAAVAVSYCSGVADAAATAIANACFFPDDAIVQHPAVTLDPTSDIPDIPVTVKVGALSSDTYAKALSRALNLAEAFVAQGDLDGAMVAAGDRQVWTRDISGRIAGVTF